MSPGWQSSALQIASSVESRIAFALPFFKMEMLAIVMPTFSDKLGDAHLPLRQHDVDVNDDGHAGLVTP